MSARQVIVPLAVLFLTLLGAGGATGQTSAGETLTGVVGPGYTITLTKSDGSAVTRIEPGTYTFEIQDLSDHHNFHLTGPGVDKTTGVAQLVNTTWTVTLTSGTYTFLCDPHPSSMTRTFTVGSTASASTKLVAAVGTGSAVTLTNGGKKVTSLAAGAYQIAVRDRAANGNFHLIGPGINRKTSIAGRVTASWKVTLKAGTYTYRSDTSPKQKRTVAVRAS